MKEPKKDPDRGKRGTEANQRAGKISTTIVNKDNLYIFEKKPPPPFPGTINIANIAWEKNTKRGRIKGQNVKEENK